MPDYLLAFERLLSELSAEFIQCPTDRLDALIVAAQRRVCEALGLDVSNLWQSTAEYPQALTLTHSFRRGEGPAIPLPMRADEHMPWSARMVLAGEVLAVSSLDRLPAEAATELEIRRHFNIKSLVALPLKAGKEPVFGCLAFLTVGRERVGRTTLCSVSASSRRSSHALAPKRAEERLFRASRKPDVRRAHERRLRPRQRDRITYDQQEVCKMLGVPKDESWAVARDYLDEGSRAVYAAQLEKRVGEEYAL